MRRGYVYFMANKPYGTLYTGVTGNLPDRVNQHKQGVGSDFVRRYGVTMLVWFESHETVTRRSGARPASSAGSGTGRSS